MARGPCTFKQQDLSRAVRGMHAAGVGVARVEIDKAGKIVIVTQEANDAAPADQASEAKAIVL
jgi:hypothetical protein